MQHQIAQSYTELTAARALVYNAARRKEAGLDFVRDAAMAKLFASQVASRVSGLAVEWMGGMGFVPEGLAEKYWRDSKIGAIYEGTSNIQSVIPQLHSPCSPFPSYIRYQGAKKGTENIFCSFQKGIQKLSNHGRTNPFFAYQAP